MGRQKLESLMRNYTFKSPNQQRLNSPKNELFIKKLKNFEPSSWFHFDLEAVKKNLKLPKNYLSPPAAVQKRNFKIPNLSKVQKQLISKKEALKPEVGSFAIE
jgi:hypothetical protein